MFQNQIQNIGFENKAEIGFEIKFKESKSESPSDSKLDSKYRIQKIGFENRKDKKRRDDGFFFITKIDQMSK